MFNIKSPTSYNEMLGSLSKYTFFTTLLFFVVLRIFDIVPLIEINEKNIPPIKSYKEMIEWSLSFGALPFIASLFAWFMSSSFEVHNKIAKILLIRYYWDKQYIVKILVERADPKLEKKSIDVNKVMKELYYPEVKNIDQHYVHLFWRYALVFWVLFEHLFFSIITSIVLVIFCPEKSLYGLGVYILVLFFVTAAQLLFVTVQKSKDQANQINQEKINSYFKNRT